MHGISMIEVLIAMVILSFGLLSIVALQLVSKKTVLDSDQRAQASVLGSDLISRMYSNNTVNGLNVYITTAPLGNNSLGTNEPAPNCITAACSSDQLASHDLWEWEKQLDGAAETVTPINGVTTSTGGLINPTACISGPPGAVAGIYTVTIVWRSSVFLPPNTGLTCGGTDDGYHRSMVMTAFIDP